MTASKTVHVLIQGRVQGVGYRAWTHHQAELHGLKGWVRNRRDGAVEAVFSGPEDLVEVVLKACRQGPRGAVVERVEQLSSNESSVNPSGRFEVRETV
jgi:acylphosphatase